MRNAKIQKIREGLQKSSHWSQYFKNLEFEEGNRMNVKYLLDFSTQVSRLLNVFFLLCQFNGIKIYENR